MFDDNDKGMGVDTQFWKMMILERREKEEICT